MVLLLKTAVLAKLSELSSLKEVDLMLLCKHFRSVVIAKLWNTLLIAGEKGSGKKEPAWAAAGYDNKS